MYYAFIKNNKIIGCGETVCLNEDILNYEISSEIFDNIENYIWDGSKVIIDPELNEKRLKEAKEEKYKEANQKANEFLQSGNALYEFEFNKHIEATDGNIAKMTAYALAYVTGQLKPEDTVIWNTKEDETIELTQSQIAQILQGLGNIQATVWSVQYPTFVRAIEEAATVESVEAIEIEYNSAAERQNGQF